MPQNQVTVSSEHQSSGFVRFHILHPIFSTNSPPFFTLSPPVSTPAKVRGGHLPTCWGRERAGTGAGRRSPTFLTPPCSRAPLYSPLRPVLRRWGGCRLRCVCGVAVVAPATRPHLPSHHRRGGGGGGEGGGRSRLRLEIRVSAEWVRATRFGARQPRRSRETCWGSDGGRWCCVVVADSRTQTATHPSLCPCPLTAAGAGGRRGFSLQNERQSLTGAPPLFCSPRRSPSRPATVVMSGVGVGGG